jgi:hypothetical protein
MTRTQLTSEKTKSKNEHPDPFYTHHVFNQMLSPLVEPATDATEAQIDKLLEGLGCLSDRPSTNTKLRVLLSSFLLQAQRLQDRVDRKGGVIPPFLMGLSRRIYAAVFSFMAGVMPPIAMLGRSLL